MTAIKGKGLIVGFTYAIASSGYSCFALKLIIVVFWKCSKGLVCPIIFTENNQRWLFWLFPIMLLNEFISKENFSNTEKMLTNNEIVPRESFYRFEHSKHKCRLSHECYFFLQKR